VTRENVPSSESSETDNDLARTALRKMLGTVAVVACLEGWRVSRQILGVCRNKDLACAMMR
jgi:hypothetical protein